jgi:predicted nucleic acid-binding protein
VTQFVLDASFALHWCFEDEATSASDAILTQLETQQATAWVPAIWPHDVLNALGKGVTRGRVERQKAFLFWQEIRTLPIRVVDVAANQKLLELALQHDLAVYDASYLSLAIARGLSIATGDRKLRTASETVGLAIIAP